MKILTLIARLLVGLIFVVFGLNGFLNFLSMGPMPSGLAGQFVGALVLSHYFWVVAALQIAGGALLLVNRLVPRHVNHHEQLNHWKPDRQRRLYS